MLRHLLLLLVACACWSHALASPLLEGRTRFQFGPDNATVEFGADAIVNGRERGTTGTIKVQLWALRAPYAENGLRGHLLAGFQLEGLHAGNEFRPARRNLAVTLPPRAGSYVIALVVSEFQGAGYVITDYRNFDNPVTLGPAQLFRMRGPWRWQSDPNNGSVDLWVDQISHTRTGNTGTLRLSLWATREPYRGGRLFGHEIGRSEKRALRSGFVYNDIYDRVAYAPPPPGEYYVGLFLTEFDGREYVIRAHLPSNEPTYFD